MNLVEFDLDCISSLPSVSGLIGVDEVGRGCLSGSVVVCAVYLDEQIIARNKELLLQVNDSKKLTKRKREKLSEAIWESDIPFCTYESPCTEVDKLNVLQATLKGMGYCVSQIVNHSAQLFSGVPVNPSLLLVDGDTHLKETPRGIEERSVVKGDSISSAIATASIIAKVMRDKKMADLDKKYPGYGFASNAGYGTPQHLKALRELGPCEIHRRSFSIDGKKIGELC